MPPGVDGIPETLIWKMLTKVLQRLPGGEEYVESSMPQLRRDGSYWSVSPSYRSRYGVLTLASGRECPKPRDWSRVECQNCGEKGHGRARCPNPAKEDEADGGAGADGGWGDNAGGAAAGGDGGWGADEAPAVAADGGW